MTELLIVLYIEFPLGGIGAGRASYSLLFIKSEMAANGK